MTTSCSRPPGPCGPATGSTTCHGSSTKRSPAGADITGSSRPPSATGRHSAAWSSIASGFARPASCRRRFPTSHTGSATGTASGWPISRIPITAAIS
ncbi:MAG: hypothetical protein ACK55Z_18780, partial [bacterium]